MYIVESGRRGWNLDYLIRWEEKPEGPGPGDRPLADLRIEMITGRIFDLYGEDAARVREAIRSLTNLLPDPPLSDMHSLRGDPGPDDTATSEDLSRSTS